MGPKPYKAIAAFVLTFLGLVVQALTDRGADAISTREWFIIVVGALVTTGVVYGVSNQPTT
jgi:hypothetical protein